MTTKYFALLTNQGAAKLANAAALGTQLQITQMAVGDGGGVLPTPDPAQTKLVGEKRRAALNSLKVDAANSSQIIAEQIIPEGEGGFWIREIGLYDADGVLIAVANCAETYKPQLQEGSGRTQTVRMILIVNSTSAVTLKIDPSVVLATRQYVDDKVIEVKAYTDDVMKKHIDAANPHSQYLQTAKALAEIKDAGLVAEVLKNLGLGEGAPLIGSPFAWPHSKMPNELFASMAGMVFVKANGASFSSTTYPKLAVLYPGLKLPDLRGEFIRGWDDGRGVDSSRNLLSSQEDMFKSHNHRFVNEYGTPTDRIIAYTDENNENAEANNVSGLRAWTYIFMEKTGGNETRPRNIAFNYILRAA
ncbi:probable tail fiber protein H [Pantoea ananatis AJ13355]|uniref:Probable tail fiber protein H n=4 Tax=Erwiniaceae TaxID=1903409 RepID=A0A0H3L4A3_PANAA|nr:phage tail protein [Pantoea ananatis]BAK12727.1 probable tail fiber protein H [Pantoea ananatis AJ13355]